MVRPTVDEQYQGLAKLCLSDMTRGNLQICHPEKILPWGLVEYAAIEPIACVYHTYPGLVR
jgi:hypothetical protein